MAAVKTFSQYAWDYEASASENLFGRYVSYGSVQLLASGDPVSTRASGYTLDEGWDWSRWPGTTAIYLPYEQLRYDAAQSTHRYFSDEVFAGGVSDGHNGIFATSLHDTGYNPTFRAKKTICFFDGELLCLGSDIENDDREHNTNTTLFQSRIQIGNEVTEDAFIQTYTGGSVSLIDPYGNGYVVPDAMGLTVRKGLQKSILHDASRLTEGVYASAWLNHGSAPESAGYEYTILVQTTPDAVSGYMEHPAYTVYQRDSFAHIAEHKRTGSFVYAVFDPAKPLTCGPVCGVSIPSVVMTKNVCDSDGRETLALYVTNPDLRLRKPPLGGLGNTVIMDDGDVMVASTPSTLVVELPGAWTVADGQPGVKISESGKEKTLIAFTCIDGMTVDTCLKKI